MVDRIRQLLQEKQLTPTQFADAIGIARPIVSHILSGRNKPSLEVVQKILAAFADLSMPWLLNGSGAMWATAASAASTLTASATPVATVPPTATEMPTAALNAAATNLTNDVSPPAEDTRPSEVVGRQPKKQLVGAPINSTSTPSTPAPAILSPPRRFPVATPGRTSTTTVEAPPELLQSSPAVVATPESAVAQPLVSTPAPALVAADDAPAASATNDAAAAFLLQPGKAIRRIVIFYQDGSFADYQPE
jgi:transcriptional regulator with XRE-family HTH domain